MSHRNIPTDEEFARASAAMAEDHRGLDEMRWNTLQRFEGDRLYEVWPFYSAQDEIFVIHLLFLDDTALNYAKSSDLLSDIKHYVADELERLGRGKKGEMKLEFPLDTHERVEREFDGDYLTRLR